MPRIEPSTPLPPPTLLRPESNFWKPFMNEKSRDSVLSWTLIALATAILLAIFYGAWCDIFDGRIYNPVLEWGARSRGPTHTTTQQIYRPGEMVYARVLFNKQRNISGILQWQLIDHIVRQFPERPGSLPIGVWDHEVPVERIPMDIEPGDYYFAGTVRYKVNWLSTVTYEIWTNKVTVVKP